MATTPQLGILHGHEMNDDEIAEFLTDQGVGALSMADDAWRSVVAEGSIERITIEDWDVARNAMGENAYRPDLLTNVDPQEDPHVWAIEIEE